MLLAAEAFGFAGMWRTGSYARDPWVLHELGAAPEDEVIGFLYLGSAEGSPKPIDRPVIADYVRRFTA
jgi:nitroreductase